jgi:hypothetical protein
VDAANFRISVRGPAGRTRMSRQPVRLHPELALGLAGRIAGSVLDARFAILPRRAKLTVTHATHRRHLFCSDAQEIRIT